jgi:hypothetical protein
LRAVKSAGVQIALVAMVFRALLPSGWMPMASSAWPPFTICTINGPTQISLDSSGKPTKPKLPQDDDRHHVLCHFAGANSAQTPPSVYSVGIPSVSEEDQLATRESDAPPEGDRFGPHAARAPPSLA